MLKLVAKASNAQVLFGEKEMTSIVLEGNYSSIKKWSFLNDIENNFCFKLHLKNIRGTAVFPTIHIHLETNKDSPRIGSLALYGLKNSSFNKDGSVEKKGFTEVIEIDDILKSMIKEAILSRQPLSLKLIPRHPIKKSISFTIDEVELYCRIG
ncbi:MAG: hypothetical protein JKY02_08110 [Flavobacteriaceae bacterium]|nr:hypothetical protein [Flavobacteriaceae bacterium]